MIFIYVCGATWYSTKLHLLVSTNFVSRYVLPAGIKLSKTAIKKRGRCWLTVLLSSLWTLNTFQLLFLLIFLLTLIKFNKEKLWTKKWKLEEDKKFIWAGLEENKSIHLQKGVLPKNKCASKLRQILISLQKKLFIGGLK